MKFPRLSRSLSLGAAALVLFAPAVFAEHMPFPPWNENGRIAHQDLLAKTKLGKVDVYFAGDSITRRWGSLDYPAYLANWNENFYGWNCADYAWGGDSTHQILWRLQNGEFEGMHPKVIVLLAGTNNIDKGQRPGCAEDAAEGIEALVAWFREHAPDAVIVLNAIFPRNDSPASNPLIAQVNERIKKLADGVHVRWLDISAQLADENGILHPELTMDGLHPSLAGYKVWAENLTPILEELLGPRSNVDCAPPPTGDPSAMKNLAPATLADKSAEVTDKR